MKTAKVAVAAAALTALSWGAGNARAQMSGAMKSGPGMTAAGAGQMMGSDPSASCWGDLGDLGLSPETQKSLQDKQFEVRKEAIRDRANLQIQRLDLARMLRSRTFDLKAAQQKEAEIAQTEAELRSAHLGLLHDLASVLSDEQWQTLGGNQLGTGGMMSMMGGGMMGRGMMGRGMMGGGMMGGGMMGGMMNGQCSQAGMMGSVMHGPQGGSGMMAGMVKGRHGGAHQPPAAGATE